MSLETIKTIVPILIPFLTNVIGMSTYCVFIFAFNRFISDNRILDLSLHRYNKAKHPLLKVFFAIFFWILEFIVIFPIISFFWILVYTLLLLTISDVHSFSQIILLSVSFVASIRILSYYDESWSESVSQVLPLAFLVYFFQNINFINFERITNAISMFPEHIPLLGYYLLFLMSIEFILRIIEHAHRLLIHKERI